MRSIRPGDVLASRYRLDDLLSETEYGRFWLGEDLVLARPVAIHVLDADDERTPEMMAAARRSATIPDTRLLRVLDADSADGIAYVVNEWGRGRSLDNILAADGPLPPRRAAYVVCEIADILKSAHEQGVTHGRLVPENVMVDEAGAVRLIGFAVDAALHGLPPVTVDEENRDLAGLLHATLTGKWAGPSRSVVDRAPEDHDRVLRPRQVRAGVPRVLDDLCDAVLNQRGQHVPAPDAREMHRVLGDFVGDPAGMADELLGRGGAPVPLPIPAAARRPAPGPAERPAASVPPTPAAEAPSAESTADSTADSTAERPAADPDATQVHEATVDEPTQLGMPIFDDDSDEVAWFNPRPDKAPPPPPFEPPPERPLFAPDPPEGAPIRRSRLPAAAAAPEEHTQAGGEYWPWAGGTDGAEDQPVPGRTWLRLAGAVAAAMLLVVGVVMAYNIGRGRGPLGAAPEEDAATQSPTASATPRLEPVAGITALDLDPEGDEPKTENRDIVGNAVDGDPGTTWRTQTYEDQFGTQPPALKSGVGLVVDLQQEYAVGSVDLTLRGAPTGLSVFVTDDAPAAVTGLTAAATGSLEEQGSIELDEPVTGRYVTLWITSLPAVAGGFRAEVAEIVVHGERP